MPILKVKFERWAGIGDNSEFSPSGADAPTPWRLKDSQLMDALGYDIQRNRVSRRPSQLGADVVPTDSRARGFAQARGQGYDKPILWTPAGKFYHYDSGSWNLVDTIANAGTPNNYQSANGMGRTLVPFGGTASLYTYNGSTLVAISDAPTGLAALHYHRLSNRFIGFVDGEDLIRFCANNDHTAWTTGGGSTEFIGNDRYPITALADGPGDYMGVFKRNYTFFQEKSSPADWNFRRKATDRGCLGIDAWAKGPNGSIFFAHESGIWIANGEGGILPQPLTYPIRRAWKNRVEGNPGLSPFTCLSYDANEEELWVLVPNYNGLETGLGELWRMYVPDGSWMLESTITAGGPAFYSKVAHIKHPTSGLYEPFLVQENDTTNIMGVYQLDATGARSSSFIRTKPFGSAGEATLAFGTSEDMPLNGRKAVFGVKARGAYNVRVTPTLWLEDGTTSAGQAQDFSLAGTAGRALFFEVALPDLVGHGIDFKFENLAQDNIFDVESLEIPYEVVSAGVRKV